MSTWSKPYVQARDRAGAPQPWAVPVPLPAADDASAWQLPADHTVVVRWRAPGFPNARKRTFAPADRAALTHLLHQLETARRNPAAWAAAGDGTPVPAPEPAAAPSQPVADPVPPAARPRATAPESQLATLEALDPTNRAAVSPRNLLVRSAAAGELTLGATVADVAAMVLAERQSSWGSGHDTNIRNVLSFVTSTMVYREPYQDDPPEVAAWKRARLDIPGVEEGASLHVALILAPDLADAIAVRRVTDRRVERLNEQAMDRWSNAWARYTQAVAAQQAGTRRGRLPARPAEQVALREPAPQVEARTEELFANSIRMLLGHAENHGLLLGPNPWRRFAARGGHGQVGFRRPQPLAVHERNVPPLGAVLDLAEAIATQGPPDPRTGRPTGDRLRALVVLSAMAARPSEYWALRPSDYRPGPHPTLTIAGAAGPVNAASSPTGDTYERRDILKDRGPGQVRVLPLPRAAADALDAHLAAGYASAEHLFTAPEGGPVRWGNLIDRYWKPAVQQVFGHSSEPLLRDLQLRWLRKGAITWLLRAGMPLTQVAETAGHSPTVLLEHYAGVVARHQGTRQWTGWDDAWAWASQEHDLP